MVVGGHPGGRAAISASGRPASARSRRRSARPSCRRGPFFRQAEGAQAVEGVEGHLRVDLVQPLPQVRPFAQERIHLADIAKNVPALDRGGEGRLASRPDRAWRSRNPAHRPPRAAASGRPRRGGPEAGAGRAVGAPPAAEDALRQADGHVDPGDQGASGPSRSAATDSNSPQRKRSGSSQSISAPAQAPRQPSRPAIHRAIPVSPPCPKRTRPLCARLDGAVRRGDPS